MGVIVITVESKGSFKKTESFLSSMSKKSIYSSLEKYANEGVNALEANTPVKTGLTATSWSYEITSSRGLHSITWINENLVDGIPVVILLQYGHGTGSGGYIKGEDFINPTLKPIFDKIANETWKAVTSA